RIIIICDVSDNEQRTCAKWGAVFSARYCEEAFQPAIRLTPIDAGYPIAVQRFAHTHSVTHARWRERMLKGCAQVVQLDLGFGVPANLVGAEETRPQPLGLSGEKREMPVADLFDLIRSNQLFTAVLAYRLKHLIARFSHLFVWHNERFVDQVRQKVEHIRQLDTLATANILGGLERPAAGEYRQPPEQYPLVIAEKVVTPVNGRA